MTPGERVLGYLDAVAAALKDGGGFGDVRLHLDPYEIADVMKESFRPPAARLFLLRMNPETEAGGDVGVEMTAAIAAIAGRSGRPDPEKASADLAAMDLILGAAALIRQDPYFGQGRVTAAQLEGFQVATSEKSNDKGLAITLLQFKATFLGLVPAWDPTVAIADPTRPAGLGLTLNGVPSSEGAP